MDNQNVEYYLTIKTNMDEPQEHNAKWQKSDMKDHILCDSIYMKYPEEANIEIKLVITWSRKSDYKWIWASFWGKGGVGNVPKVHYDYSWMTI